MLNLCEPNLKKQNIYTPLPPPPLDVSPNPKHFLQIQQKCSDFKFGFQFPPPQGKGLSGRWEKGGGPFRTH